MREGGVRSETPEEAFDGTGKVGVSSHVISEQAEVVLGERKELLFVGKR